MAGSFDHILVIGFGGPTKPEEIKPFLEQVARGVPIPASRLEDVARHYEAIGGRSPYHEHACRLVEKLTPVLKKNGMALPVFLGMRNWHPFLKDVMADIKKKNLKRGIGIILAPHRSDASYGKYLRAVDEARQAAGALEVTYEYLKPWHDHPLFIEAQADCVKEALGSSGQDSAHFIFTAHSIPAEMAGECRYAEEFKMSASLVAGRLGLTRWSTAYQSRSGNPRQPWLGPDVLEAVRALKEKNERKIVLVPIGFVLENAEILCDLDIEARSEVLKLGMEYHRSATVMDHPKFVQMLVSLCSLP